MVTIEEVSDDYVEAEPTLNNYNNNVDMAVNEDEVVEEKNLEDNQLGFEHVQPIQQHPFINFQPFWPYNQPFSPIISPITPTFSSFQPFQTFQQPFLNIQQPFWPINPQINFLPFVTPFF